MDRMISQCAGLDVPKQRMTACRVPQARTGLQADGLLELQDFGTII
jgi:hypothetical protein